MLLAAVSGDALARIIIRDIRFPRLLLSLAAGASLGGAGAVSQMYFQNPIAEPGIMGLTAGAALGAVAASIAGAHFANLGASYIVNIGAFCGALLSGGFLLAVLQAAGSVSPLSIILCGASMGTFFSAAVSMILLSNSGTLRAMFVWALGSMSGRGYGELRIIALPLAASFALQFRLSRTLDLFSGGEVAAVSLGADVKSFSRLALVTLSLSVSVAVCAGGTIGFVGLIAPHIARRFFSPRARVNIASSAFLGAMLLAASDIAARTIASPSELPVGTVTSFIGAPFFFYLMVKQSKRRIL